MRVWRNRYLRACLAGVVVLTIIVFFNDFGHFNTDIKPEVYIAPWAMVGRYFSSWTSSPYLGSANFNVGLVPVLLPLALLRAIGFSPEWAYKIFHLGLWVLAAWGTNRLTRAAAPKVSPWVGLAAGAFYLANPYTIAAGNTLAIALPMAFLPWMLLAYVRGLQSPRSWGPPAAFGLAFFAMSGMNVAVVPLFQLLGIIPIALVARWHRHRPLSTIFAVTAKCALFVLGVSLYWLIPGIAALSAGTQVVQTSETLDGISKVSSLTEVLRGLGLWPLYGHSDQGAWVPQNAAYVSSAFVILLTAAWPILALVSMRWARSGLRRVATIMVLLASVVMVGLFPRANAAESPAGWVLQWLLSFPPLAAFRTTNKIGALLALAFAMGLAGGAVWLVRHLQSRPGLAPIAASLSVVLVAAWILPAIDGGLYISRMDVPGYWRDAAHAADGGNPNSTTLLLPSQVRPTYRWSVQRPDDVTNSLMKRDAVIPETTPNASAAGGNFLAALGDVLQEGSARGPVMSTFARYLGSDRVLLRRDEVWEADGGARPSIVNSEIISDGGLIKIGTYGRPSLYTVAPYAPSEPSEQHLNPLELFRVSNPTTAVRAQSTTGQLVVAGDGWAFPQMINAGLLTTTPVVRYAQDVDSSALAQALAGGAGLVISDTNARRNVIPQRLSAGEGALLPARTKLGETRTLGTNPRDETTLVEDGAQATATDSGGTFFDLPYASADNAIDGDPNTSWRFGDFNRAPGQKLHVTLDGEHTLGDIPISQANLGPVKIARVTLKAGGKQVSANVPDSGNAILPMGGVRAKTLTLTIDSTRGNGYNLVGINELGIPGAKALRVAATPTTITALWNKLSASDRERFANTPLDILLTRVLNTTSLSDDTETTLNRQVSLPDARTLMAHATVRVQTSLDDAYNRLTGTDPAASPMSSDIYFNKGEFRAALAADGDTVSGWIPGGHNMAGQWWQIGGKTRTIGSVKVTQARGVEPTAHTEWAKRVTIMVDGRAVAHTDLKANGTTTINLPKGTHGRTVRLVINTTRGKGAPAKFTTIDTGTSVHTTNNPRACLPVATVDGHSVMMRPDNLELSNTQTPGSAWTSCQSVSMSSGTHHVAQAQGFTLDSLNFMDHQGSPASPASPKFAVKQDDSAAKRIILTATHTPVAVVIGQSYDPRWQASLNGVSLGSPTTIDGFSTGWILPAGSHGTLNIWFAPQEGASLGMGISLIALLIALGFVLWQTRRGWEPEPEPAIREERRALKDAETRERGANLPRAVGFVALASLAFGFAGLIAAAVAAYAIHTKRASARALVLIGAGLVGAGMVAFLLLDPVLGQVSADAISSSLWPHRICAFGLTLTIAGLLRRTGQDAPLYDSRWFARFAPKDRHE